MLLLQGLPRPSVISLLGLRQSLSVTEHDGRPEDQALSVLQQHVSLHSTT